MALVERLKGGQKTSAKIAESLLSMALNEGTSSGRTDVVFDDCQGKGKVCIRANVAHQAGAYPGFLQDDSIKRAKRENRGKGLRS